ncbi:hypothetical protein GALMADRAFT_145132 [Galerina marginata CBS 339.88]|uniref:Uncharacterized protein n=1 Tax=Galerina marginata (strain CBS 339.88) TaxID=685588 RepID=A0A067SSG5_GALM3|nr:hypothetical protein GALMADRAFT_145132 [Galerina marginata CBS 339.88]
MQEEKANILVRLPIVWLPRRDGEGDESRGLDKRRAQPSTGTEALLLQPPSSRPSSSNCSISSSRAATTVLPVSYDILSPPSSFPCHRRGLVEMPAESSPTCREERGRQQEVSPGLECPRPPNLPTLAVIFVFVSRLSWFRLAASDDVLHELFVPRREPPSRAPFTPKVVGRCSKVSSRNTGRSRTRGDPGEGDPPRTHPDASNHRYHYTTFAGTNGTSPTTPFAPMGISSSNNTTHCHFNDRTIQVGHPFRREVIAYNCEGQLPAVCHKLQNGGYRVVEATRLTSPPNHDHYHVIPPRRLPIAIISASMA